MKTLYDLAHALRLDPKHISDTQALTLDETRPQMGLKGAYGLFASDAWWDNLKSGVIPTARYQGEINDLKFEGMHNEGRAFTLRCDDGSTYSYSCIANDKANLRDYRIGRRLTVTSFIELKKTGAPLEMIWKVEMEGD